MIVYIFSLMALGVPSVDEIVQNAQKSIHLRQHKTELILTVEKKTENQGIPIICLPRSNLQGWFCRVSQSDP